jgi:hypothetical protein
MNPINLKLRLHRTGGLLFVLRRLNFEYGQDRRRCRKCIDHRHGARHSGVVCDEKVPARIKTGCDLSARSDRIDMMTDFGTSNPVSAWTDAVQRDINNHGGAASIELSDRVTAIRHCSVLPMYAEHQILAGGVAESIEAGSRHG